jgi:hypothetical protein
MPESNPQTETTKRCVSRSRTASKRQLAVIEDLFTGELEERAVLDKHGVKPTVYSRWLADERFIEHFERRIAQAHRAGRLILARSAPKAAAKLVELTQGEKEEVARKACLDIIALTNPAAADRASQQDDPEADDDTHLPARLPPETASRILAVLADNGPSHPV